MSSNLLTRVSISILCFKVFKLIFLETPTPASVSRERRTQEELKAIEALEELSRLEPMNMAPVATLASQPSVQMDDTADQIEISEDYKGAVMTPSDVIPVIEKELSEPPLSNLEIQLPISTLSTTVLPGLVFVTSLNVCRFTKFLTAGKRKIADIDAASPDPSRDRKKIRDESVPTDDEAGMIPFFLFLLDYTDLLSFRSTASESKHRFTNSN